MKKITVIVGCILLLGCICFIPLGVRADFGSKVLQEVQAEVQGFYQRNGAQPGGCEANRITLELMEGFMFRVNGIFEKNRIPVAGKVPEVPAVRAK